MDYSRTRGSAELALDTTISTSSTAPSTVVIARSKSIDSLRGLVMVLMALDHVRDFFTHTGINPTDLTQVTSGLFLTRWVTHLCAPVFVFLTGVGAYLSFSSGKKSKTELSAFLFKRGLWMIFLELTFIRLGWYFNVNYQATELQVFWVLGVSMIVLAGLIFLPLTMIALTGALILGTHNAFDGVSAKSFGEWSWAWTLLHERGTLFSLRGYTVSVLYPLVPWIGVTALGYCFGSRWKKYPLNRSRWLSAMGLGAITLFGIIRSGNFYGDPSPWQTFASPVTTVLSFINVTKYPPSLQYLLVMLGVALLLLSMMEKFPRLQRPALVTLGRVPLFYYVLHLFLIHALAVAGAFAVYGTQLPSLNLSLEAPPGYGYPLPVVFAVWALVVGMLYPACVWFADVKRKSTNPLLSYL